MIGGNQQWQSHAFTLILARSAGSFPKKQLLLIEPTDFLAQQISWIYAQKLLAVCKMQDNSLILRNNSIIYSENTFKAATQHHLTAYNWFGLKIEALYKDSKHGWALVVHSGKCHCKCVHVLLRTETWRQGENNTIVKRS